MIILSKSIKYIMKTTIGIYSSHHEALETVKELQNAGFSKKQLTIIGKVKKDEEVGEDTLAKVAGTEVGISVLAGSTLGVLTGIGIFAIPGLGFLFGAGALAGAIAGFDFGLIGGGIISALTLPNIHGDIANKYEDELKGGKFLVIAQGTEEEVSKAKEMMQAHGKYSGLETH